MGSSQSVDKPKNRILFKDGLLSPNCHQLPFSPFRQRKKPLNKRDCSHCRLKTACLPFHHFCICAFILWHTYYAFASLLKKRKQCLYCFLIIDFYHFNAFFGTIFRTEPTTDTQILIQAAQLLRTIYCNRISRAFLGTKRAINTV